MEEAKRRKLSGQLGVPAAILPPTAQAEEQAFLKNAKAQEIMTKYPGLAKWAQNPDNAAVAGKDMLTLGEIENTARGLPSVTDSVLGVGKNLAGSAAAAFPTANAAIWSFVQAASSILSVNVTKPLADATGLPDVGEMMRGSAADFRNRQLGMARDVAPNMSGMGAIERGVYSGVQSAATTLMMLPLSVATGSPTPVLAGLSGITAGNALGEATDKGLPLDAALVHATKQGLIEYGTELFPMGNLLKNLTGKTGLVRTAKEFLIREGVGEQVATHLQDLDKWATLNPEKPFSEYIAERPEAALETLVATAVGGSIQVGGAKVVAKGIESLQRKSVLELQQAQRAEEHHLAIQQLGTMAATHPLKERDPQAFHDFMETMAEDGNLSDVYVDGKVLNDVFNQSGITEDELMRKMPEVVQQLGEAMKTNGEVRISLADYATYVVGTDAEKGLLNHLRASPEGMTYTEAQEFYKTQKDGMTKDAEKLMADAAASEEYQADVQKVHDTILEQMNKAGRFTPEVNAAYAVPFREFYAVNAAKMGMTPSQLYEQLPLNFAPMNAGNILNQGEDAFDFSASNEGNVPKPDVKVGDTTIQYGFDFTGEKLKIYSVRTPQAKRGKGSARKAMEQFLQQADREGKTVYLDASALDKKTSTAKLVKFYESLGFVLTGKRANALGEPEMKREPQVLNQSVFHGTPHVWAPEPGFPHGRPRLDKMGTGEGAQAFGWGWYSAENQGVADDYRKTLSGPHNRSLDADVNTSVVIEDMSGDGDWRVALRSPTRMIGSAVMATESLTNADFESAQEAYEYAKKQGWINSTDKHAFAMMGDEDRLQPIDSLDNASGQIVVYDPGTLYTLDIPDSVLPRLLDWDKPLSEQTPEVREALEQFKARLKGKRVLDKYLESINLEWNELTGADLYNEILDRRAPNDNVIYGISPEIDAALDEGHDNKAAALYLNSLGIVGNRYLDGGSRVDGKGTYNYVLWDQATIDKVALIERNGEKLDAMRELAQGNRAGYNPDTFTISLLKGADLSSTLHEGGHFYLEALADLASRPEAPQQIKDDFRKTLDWFGITGNENLEAGTRGGDLGQSPNVISLQKRLKAADAKIMNSQYGTPERDVAEKEAAKIRAELSKLTGDPYGETKKAKIQRPPTDALDAEYTTPDEIPNNVWDWVSNNTSLLYGDASDAVRLWRIVDTLQDERYPDDDITIYRAVSEGGEIRPGDWVTVDYRYAEEHLRKSLNGRGQILEETVNGRDVLSSPTGDAEEAIYAPRVLSGPRNTLNQGGDPGTPGELPPGRTPEEVWRSMSLDQKRPYHEQWAQSFERYMLEGKAPTTELQPVFARFRAWMLNVYRSLEKFLQQNPLAGKLNDEVRGIFDRLLAAEDNIRAAESVRSYAPIFENAEEAGITPKQFQDYLDLGEQATQQAIDDMSSRSLRDMKWLSNAKEKVIKELQNEAKAKRKAVEEEVHREVMAEPIELARTFLKTGETTDPETGDLIKAEAGFKLDSKAVAELFPASGLVTFDKDKLRGMTSTEGLSPELAAQMFGFPSGEALILELTTGETAKEKIQGITDQRMLERHGEMASEEDIQRAAEAAIHNEARARFMATGLKILSKSPLPVNQISKAAKAAAENTIASRKVRDLRPSQYQRAEAQANKEAMKLAGKDPQGAVHAQRAALLNNRLAKAAAEATKEVEKALRYVAKFQNKGTRDGLDPEYLEQIDDLLRPFEFKKGTSLKQIDKRQSLADWVSEQEALGFEPAIDPSKLDEAKLKSYKNMTMEELRGFVDSIKQVEHLGRLKKKLLTAKDQREFDAIVLEGLQSIEDNANRTVEEKATPTDAIGIAGKWWRQMTADHRKFSSIMREMDGGKNNGFMFNYFLKTMNEAGDNETQMKAEATEALAKLFSQIKKDPVPGNIYAKKRLVPGTNLSMSHEQRIMFAMNWGNEGNRQRLLDGGITGNRALSLPQAEAVLDTLTKEEWDFVQGVWDYIATYKDRVASLEKRLTGIEPQWIEPAPVQTKYGTYRGGYFPVKYDTELSSRSESFEAATDLRMGMKGAFNASATRNGFTKARAEAVINRPILLSYNAVAQHVSEVTHRLAWQEWLVDANRLLKALDNPIRQHYGAEILRTLRDTVVDIAAGDAPAKNGTETAINRLRVGSTVVGMGWRVTTALLQPSGLAQSWVRVGGKYIARGVKQFMKSPLTSGEFVNSKSKLMTDRGRTMQREINEVLNTIRAGDKVSAFKASYFTMIGKMQRMVDIPTWLGAYERATDELKLQDATTADERARIEEQAAALADQAVLDSQSGGQLKDLAKVQRGSPLQKIFTNFYSYFSATYNLNVEAVRRTNFKSPSQVAMLATDMLLLNTVPIVFSVALKELLKGGCGDDLECLGEKLASEQLNFLFGQMVLLREAGVAIDVAAGGQGFGYQGPAGLRFFADLYKLGAQTNQGEADIAFFKAANQVAGAILHYPAGQINATMEGIIAIEEGKVEGVNVLTALIAGPPKK
jgi:predicted GNAT family acetyltransferase